MHAFVFLFSALCSLCTASFAESSKTSLSGFSIELIHHDSPQSPFYNSSMTPSQLIRNAALRSVSRSNQVFNSLSVNENKSPESIIIPSGGDYLMKIYIGTPPVERFAFADTGSDLIWVHCSPCNNNNCFPQDTPYYDPTKSSTFMGVSCESQPCTFLPRDLHRCGNSNQCEYSYAYADNSFTKGELGTDSISFGEDVTFPKSIFGCGHKNNFTYPVTQNTTGLVGLGAGRLSLVSQLGDAIGHKFSYCLVPYTSTKSSKLKFGSEATISGNGVVVSTPLIIKSSNPTFYFLNLEGITVGKKTVQTGRTDGNIIIDSGTTLTILEQSFYNDFVTSVKEAIGVEAVQNPPSGYDFCFSTTAAEMNFPDFVFHFTGAGVSLKPENLLIRFDNNYSCLMVVPTTSAGGVSIFGNRAQMDFQVVYDLQGKTISFAPTDCTLN